MTDTTVLYVGGTGRSGSTVLANLLGEVTGYVSVGEVRFLWERGIVEDRLCGCGRRFSQCDFWVEVLDRAFGDDRPAAQDLHVRLYDKTRLRSLPAFVLRGVDDALPDSASGSPADLSDVLARLYAAIAAVAGATVVVDSSKLPTYAATLARVPGLDVRILHLVRDPRAAAFSWLRQKEQPDRVTPGYMEQRGVLKSAGLWTSWNGALELMWRGRRSKAYHRLAYEDFVASPRSELGSIVSWMGSGSEHERCFTGENTVRLGVHHTVAGNPARLDRGDVSLTLDDEWVEELSRGDQRLVRLGTLPLLHRYGYPSHPGPRGGHSE